MPTGIRNCIEGGLGTVISVSGGLAIFAPDHEIPLPFFPHVFQPPIAGHSFDIFGAMAAIHFYEMVTGKDDFYGGFVVAVASALGLEFLQYQGLVFGHADFLGDGIVSPLIGAALVLGARLLSREHRHNIIGADCPLNHPNARIQITAGAPAPH